MSHSEHGQRMERWTSGKKRGAVRATARRRGGSEVSAVFRALRAEGLGCILLLLRNLLFGRVTPFSELQFFIYEMGKEYLSRRVAVRIK